jgi:ATP-dependent exoDNAse (exonuclease V) beta subunit
MTHIFDRITFEPESHTYILDGQELTSVGRTLDRLKPVFDRPGKAASTARRTGQTVEEVLAEWDAKRDASLALGTRVHEHIELVLTGAYEPADPFLALNTISPEERAFNRFWQEIGSRLRLERAEWIIGDAVLGIGGRPDAIFASPDTGQFHLFDWKTGKCESFNKWENLLAPFDDLSNCAVAIYSLQASLYRLILERNTDLVFGDSYLLHLQSSGEFRVIKVDDYRARLLDWLTS